MLYTINYNIQIHSFLNNMFKFQILTVLCLFLVQSVAAIDTNTHSKTSSAYNPQVKQLLHKMFLNYTKFVEQQFDNIEFSCVNNIKFLTGGNYVCLNLEKHKLANENNINNANNFDQTDPKYRQLILTKQFINEFVSKYNNEIDELRYELLEPIFTSFKKVMKVSKYFTKSVDKIFSKFVKNKRAELINIAMNIVLIFTEPWNEYLESYSSTVITINDNPIYVFPFDNQLLNDQMLCENRMIELIKDDVNCLSLSNNNIKLLFNLLKD